MNPLHLPVPALVLAGGKTRPEFAAVAGVSQRALADINGQPMVRYVLRALQQAATVGPVILVAPADFPTQPEADFHVAADGGLEENVRLGLRACGASELALIVTADIPFLRPASVDDYVRQCVDADVDCCYAAIPAESCRERFPHMRRTYIRASNRSVTGGNVVLQRLSTYDQQAATLREAYRRRKSPLFLARLIGAGSVLRLMTGRLTNEDIERGASRLMGVRCRLIVTPHADLGTDVDRPEDLRLAREMLRPE
jgi:GTP:adenosylcobinamide-phosphate guanylyltransferase